MTGRQDPAAGAAAGPAGPYVDEYPAGPLPSGEPRSWEEIRAAALAAVRAARARKAEDIIDLALSVCDEETVSRLAAKLIADTGIRAADFRNGASMDLEPAREAVALWVGIARGILNGGPNYSETLVGFDDGTADPEGTEMTVGLAGDPERYVFRLQRAGRLTPHEARQLAERRAADAERARDEALAEVAWLRAELAGKPGAEGAMTVAGPRDLEPAGQAGSMLSDSRPGMLWNVAVRVVAVLAAPDGAAGLDQLTGALERDAYRVLEADYDGAYRLRRLGELHAEVTIGAFESEAGAVASDPPRNGWPALQPAGDAGQ